MELDSWEGMAAENRELGEEGRKVRDCLQSIYLQGDCRTLDKLLWGCGTGREDSKAPEKEQWGPRLQRCSTSSFLASLLVPRCHFSDLRKLL